ncbi:MAG: hypothetical protein J6R54_08620 [Bacteroidaceae bacterium]|nr:hypothetical protein [Bacteroidaceae bacterium]
MYCSLGQNQFFDDAGAPLSAGRVKIYANGSDTLLPIYEYNGDGFVPTQNPVITSNDGRIPTVFWPAALVDVVVEKSNGDGTYTELDSYVAGLDMTSVEAVQGVSRITELRSIKPSENMVVQVNGYYTAGDSPTRKYLWVSGAANTDDGGYVIASNVNSGGRWVMLWDDPEFLPVSLYGIMCGYLGYSKTSNIPALESLGHYVIVGSVRVEVPPVILFDGRMAQPTSGESSPVAYYWYGTMTTTHYVACARGVTFSATSTPPTIHCAGVRGESYANAYWLVDQDYTTKDPAEKISTLMFNGNTAAMHDAFMSCAACSKVKVVELFDGALYPTLINTDTFSGKIIVDYASTIATPPAYIYTGSILISPSALLEYATYLKANEIRGNTIISSGSLYAGANVYSDYDVQASRDLIFDNGIKFKGKNTDCITNPNDDVNFYPNSPKFPHGLYLVGALNATTLSDSQRKMHVNVVTSGTMTVDLTDDSQTLSATSFYNSKYKENDIVVVSNTGSGTLSVVAVANASTVVLNQNESCAFIKVGSSRWNRMSPA